MGQVPGSAKNPGTVQKALRLCPKRKDVLILKKRLTAILLLAAMLCGAGPRASAWGVGDQLTVTGYDPNADYTTLMIRALKDGGAYAMQIGAIYERQRNLKIDDMGLTQYKKTSYFVDYSTAEEILQAMEDAKKPKPTYTAEDLDLLARIINAEAGCDWMPDWVQRMVGSVVLNRVKSNRFPNTIREVIYQPGQYGPVTNGSIHKKPTQKVLKNAKYVLENGPNCPEGVVGQSGFIQGKVHATYYDPYLGTTMYFCYM